MASLFAGLDCHLQEIGNKSCCLKLSDPTIKGGKVRPQFRTGGMIRITQAGQNSVQIYTLGKEFGGEAGIDSGPSLGPRPSGALRARPDRQCCRSVEPTLVISRVRIKLVHNFTEGGNAPFGKVGGEAGIRTLGALMGTLDFESSPFDRSGTSPVSMGCCRATG